MAKMVEGHLKVAMFRTRYATEGSLGIIAAREWEPDLVLLDVMMPGMDGFTTCERIREFSTVPVIILTAKGEERDKVRGLDAGADDYIVNLSQRRSCWRVSVLFCDGQSRPVFQISTAVFQHCDLVIDFARAEVRVDGKLMSLTATEYKLLQTLSESMGKVLSPEELLTRIWGVDYRNEKEILWVTLSRLRQKVEKDPKNPIHILTRQGLGYLMPTGPDHNEYGRSSRRGRISWASSRS